MFDAPVAPPEPSPAVESRLLLLGIWRRRVFICVMVVISLLLGYVASKQLEGGTYVSETRLLSDPQAFRAAWDRDAISPSLLAARVTSPAVLQATARTLDLPQAAVEKGSSANADRDTGVLRIEGRAKQPLEAQRVSRALTAAFVADLKTSLVNEKKREIAHLRQVYTQANAEVVAASRDVQAFLLVNGVSASDMTLGQTSGPVEQLRLACTEAEAEANALLRQQEGLQASMRDLRARAREERAAARATADDGASERRSARLLALVQDDRARQTNEIALRQSEVELRRAQALFREGFISRQELERSREVYEKNRAMLSDDARYQEWKRTSAKLAAASVAPNAPQPSPSEGLLAQMLTQEQTLRLQIEAARRRATNLRLQYVQAVELRARLPRLQAQYDAVAHVLTQRQFQRNEAQTRLARAEAAVASDGPGLPGVTLLSDADLPTAPLRSRGKLIWVLVTGGVLLMSLVLVVLADWRDRRLKAPSQLPALLSVPILGTIPRLSPRALAADPRDAGNVDFRAMARRLREQVPTPGARVLLISPGRAEGKSLVVDAMARELRRRGESVLVIDAAAHLRDDPSSTRLGTLLREASRGHDLTIIEGVALDEAHTALMAANVDAVVLVLENHIHQIDTIRRLVDDLGRHNAPLVGGIVTKVDPFYLALENLPA